MSASNMDNAGALTVL